MGSPDWYRWYPAKWATGVIMLTPEQRGVYIDVINIILERGSCPEDYAFLAKVCGCRIDRVRRVISELVGHRKLTIGGGTIRQERANNERRMAEELTLRARSRVSKRYENNDLASTSRVEKSRVEDTDTSLRSVSPTHGVGERASRLPDDWSPDQDQAAYAIALGLDPDSTAEDFRDYWCSKAGRDAFKRNWNRTWQSWCRKAAEFKARQRRTSSNGRSHVSISEAARNVARRMEQIREDRERAHEAAHGDSFPRLVAG